jgi:hypothetical protein
VYEASQSATINKIFVSGTITAASEGGVWYEDTGTPAFHLNSSGAPPALKLSDSVVNITGTNGKQITIVGVDGAGISGTTGKRAVSVTGGAKIVFENMTISGGRSAGNGGGVYIGGNSLVKFSGGMITGNQAVSGGGVYVGGDPNDDSEFDLAGGSVSGNTATGSSTAMSTLAGGGGVYVNGKSVFWLTNGTVANNTAGGGSGGGVLVNGWIDTTDPTNNRGFLMSGGSIANNKSLGSASPHGGGGVYVAAGEFDMLNGDISNNTSTRQGGGVFVHRNSIFSASGSSSILGNNGVGSSKALCSRGITELSGNARLDKVYVWNADPDPDPDPSNPPGFPGNSFSFTISGGARADGIVLAGYTKDVPDYNYITIGSLTGSDPVCTVDLESHLEDGKLVGSTNTAISNDWNGRTILRAGSMNAAVVSRFPLGSFTGSSTINLAPYWRIDSGTGKLVH